MEEKELFCEWPLEPSIVEQIYLGDWSGLNDKLNQALLVDSSHDSTDSNSPEATLCSQLLRVSCTADGGHAFPDPELFSSGVAKWIDHYIETLKNSDQAQEDAEFSVESARKAISAAFIESIWSLGVEWEPDTEDIGEESLTWWKEKQMRMLEQSKQLVVVAKSLISAGVIDADLAKERLDPDFLEQIDVIPSATVFNKKYIRLNTALNFKQTKYNLIREQSEGFSKLVALIQATMAAVVPSNIESGILGIINSSDLGPQAATQSPGTNVMQAIRSLDGLQERVSSLLVDIHRLIGLFNIDPNRVVDIILDCFISNVRHYWAFYIALLDASPWCKSEPESQKLAHLVGWKFQFYINSTDSEYRYTDELTTIAALLISHGLIRLSDLYSQLAPASPEAMDKEFDAWCAKQKEEQAMAGGNSLSMMGGLDGALGEDGEEGEESKKESEAAASAAAAKSGWANQHANLCAKLLSVGDSQSALIYLKRFLNLARVHQPIADLVARIIEVSTRDLYKSTDCVRAPPRLRLRLRAGTSAPTRPDDHSGFNAWGLPESQPQPVPDTREPLTFVLTPLVKKPHEAFFYEKFWLAGSAKHLPAVKHICDLPRALAPWLQASFHRIHHLPGLLTRLIRLCKYGMKQYPSDADSWIGFLRAWIIPAYSLSPSSAGLSNELWLLVSMLPLAQRYELYSHWDTMMTTSKPMLPNIVPNASTDAGGGSRAKPTVDLMSMSLDDALEDEDDDSYDMSGSFSAGKQKPLLEIELLYQDLRRKVRSVMRRLSGDTVKLMGRQLCSLCHPVPMLSLKIVLDQVCSYDNLVTCVVEAFRYLTPMDIDVLFFTILGIIDDPSRARLKPDGVNPAHWLQSLSSFIAAYGHRHEHQRLDVILEYLLKRTIRMIKAGPEVPPVHELIIASDCILTLAAIEPLSNAIDDQVQALQGGPHLRLEAYSMHNAWGMQQDATVEDVISVNTTNRLTRRMALWLTSLLVEKNMALPFVISLCVHAEKMLRFSSLPLSNMMVFYDREYERIVQLFCLLQSNLSAERYAKLIPCPQDLVTKFGLRWEFAILWGRPNISKCLREGLRQWEENGEQVSVQIIDTAGKAAGENGEKEEKGERDDKPSEPVDEDKEGKGEAGNPKVADEESSESKMDVDQPEAEGKKEKLLDAVQIVEDLKFETPVLPRDFVEHIAKMLPQEALDKGLSAEFVAVFWTLTLYDIEVPVARYDKEIGNQQNVIKRVDALIERTHSRSKAATLKQMRVRAKMAIDSLEKEKEEQKLHVWRIRKWLISQKDYWFAMAVEQRKLFTEVLIQHCILPRAVMSAADASFCAKFFWMMHFPLATNKFSLLFVYDNIYIEPVANLLSTFTENETKNYARFLNACLTYLSPMHMDEKRYNERAIDKWRGLTGFQKSWKYERGYLPPRSRTIGQQTPPKSKSDVGDEVRIKANAVMLDHSEFRTVMRKWQVNLCRAFLASLASAHSDTVRNAILALKELHATFPAITKYGNLLQNKIDNIAAGKTQDANSDGSSDTVDNLKVLATSYSAILGAARRRWIPESDYYDAVVKPAPAAQPAPQKQQKTASSANTREAQGAKDGKQAEHKTDSAGSQRTKDTPSRIISSSALATIAAATTAASASSVKTPDADTDSQKQPKQESSSRRGAAESSNKEGKENKKQTGQQRAPGPQHPPKHADGRQKQDSSTSWASSLKAGHGDTQPEPQSHKRTRQDSLSDSQLEPPRQRQTTPANAPASAKSPSISESNQQKKSSEPTASDQHIALPPAASVASTDVAANAASASSTASSSKLTSEEVDRKRRELRAQLLKQQEEKQKQKQSNRRENGDISVTRGGPASDSKDEETYGASSSRSSSRAGRSRNAGDTESKEPGGDRRSGRGSGRQQQQQQQQQQQRNSSNQNTGVLGRLGPSSSSSNKDPTPAPHDRQQQQQRHHDNPRRNQPTDEHRARTDHSQRRHDRDRDRDRGGSSSRHQSPARARGNAQSGRYSSGNNSPSFRSSTGGSGQSARSNARTNDQASSGSSRRAADGGRQSGGYASRHTPKRGRGPDQRDRDDGKRHRR